MVRVVKKLVRKVSGPVAVLALLSALTPNSGLAADAYYDIPLRELDTTAGGKRVDPTEFFATTESQSRIHPYAVLDGDGDVYLFSAPIEENSTTLQWGDEFWASDDRWENLSLAIRVPSGANHTGSLFLPDHDGTGLTKLRFLVPASKTNEAARKTFQQAKERHYRTLANQDIPGGAWFGYQALLAREAWKGSPEGKSAPTDQPSRTNIRVTTDATEVDRTYALLSGGRAVSENLQLDRLLPQTAPQEATVDLSTLKGITVREMDWTSLTKRTNSKLDPLASNLPSDQHAIFFPSFQALVTLIDEAKLNGTPVLRLLEQRSEDARVRERYERQLCLSLTAAVRLLGGQVIQSVAITGSDPYLRTGSDITVLFDTHTPAVLEKFLSSSHEAAIKENLGCQQVRGVVGDVSYSGAVTPDRSICVYMAHFGNVVAVTNSLVQLELLVQVNDGSAKSLASLPEYAFFRQRYPRDNSNETAFLMLTDSTIRRWCGPKWRIAASRRTRAAAVMARHQAIHLDRLVEGSEKPQLIDNLHDVPDIGTLRLEKSGIQSSTYGTGRFLTPIAELEFEKVTEAEASAYNRWRQGYERNWSRYFDPIAVSLSVRPQQLSADLSVMPLIAGSEYREFVAIASGAAISADAGDRHTGTLAHWAMAINVNSDRMQWAGNLLGALVKVNPLEWLGESIAIYADDDPFWRELAQAESAEDFFEQQSYRLPIAFRAEVTDSLKLTLFLTGLRAYVEQTTPGLTEWTAMKHNNRGYVRIHPTEAGQHAAVLEELAIYYAATPTALIVTLNEDLLKRALDRQVAAQQIEETDGNQGQPDDLVKPWLGESLALQFSLKGLGLLRSPNGEYAKAYRAEMQARSWANLPILNEWKRRYPERDPVKLHETFWQTNLRCPGSGKYVWNDDFQTMESTVYGHPGTPAAGPAWPGALSQIRSFNLGVSFENQGLRSRVAVEREASN
jgi:hypothetical protein